MEPLADLHHLHVAETKGCWGRGKVDRASNGSSVALPAARRGHIRGKRNTNITIATSETAEESVSSRLGEPK